MTDSKLDISSGIHVLKFSATWCSPCKVVQKTLDKLQEEFKNVIFHVVDVDDDPELAKSYKVKSIPTIVFAKDGLEKNRVVGVSLIEPLRKILNDLVK